MVAGRVENREAMGAKAIRPSFHMKGRMTERQTERAREREREWVCGRDETSKDGPVVSLELRGSVCVCVGNKGLIQNPLNRHPPHSNRQ